MDVILITGASRGIGAEVAMLLTDPERHIVVNYREKTRRANEVVESILNQTLDLEAACQRLVDAANEAGGRDNITAVLIRVDG